MMQFKCSKSALKARLNEIKEKRGRVISIEKCQGRFESYVVAWEFAQ